MRRKLTVYGLRNNFVQFSDPRINQSIQPTFSIDSLDVEPACEQVHRAVSDLTLATHDWSYRGEDEKRLVIENLRKAGRRLLETVSGGKPDAFADILNQVDILEVSTDIHVPWEFIYLGDVAEDARLEAFFGARAVVGRAWSSPAVRDRDRPARVVQESPYDRQMNAMSLPFGYAEDTRLPSAKSGDERKIFESLGIPLMTLPPLTAGLPKAKEDLAGFLGKSEVLTHFNCHAHPSTDVHPGAIVVSDVFEVHKRDIDESPVCERSIVLLNCCSGHTMLTSHKTTIASSFAQKRVKAVVATTAAINDAYATRWAQHFYRVLWRGDRVSEAMIEARNSMLREDDPNPSALLYVYLGDESTRIVNAGGEHA